VQVLFYDCEVVADPQQVGWKDYKALGISVIGAAVGDILLYFDERDPHYLERFQSLADQCDLRIGFNNWAFDDPLLAAHGIVFRQDSCDLLAEVRQLSGQPPKFTPGKTRKGYGLQALALANNLKGKTGTGAEAPALWRAGEYKKVIDYCLNDVLLTQKLYRMQSWIDPTNGNRLDRKTN